MEPRFVGVQLFGLPTDVLAKILHNADILKENNRGVAGNIKVAVECQLVVQRLPMIAPSVRKSVNIHAREIPADKTVAIQFQCADDLQVTIAIADPNAARRESFVTIGWWNNGQRLEVSWDKVHTFFDEVLGEPIRIQDLPPEHRASVPAKAGDPPTIHKFYWQLVVDGLYTVLLMCEEDVIPATVV